MVEKMSDGDFVPGLFPMTEPPNNNVTEYPKAGIVPYQGLRAMIKDEEIMAIPEITPEQVQPASLDLRLGRRAYRVRSSFLPGSNATVMDKVEQLDGLPEIDITAGAFFEKNAVYVVELAEHVQLSSQVEGIANPKSSTGRLDVLTRLITDQSAAFDRIERGYKGRLFVEIAPRTFSIVVRQGSRLNQVRFQRGTPALPKSEVQRLCDSGQLVGGGQVTVAPDGLVPVTVDLHGKSPGDVVGYKAHKHTDKIDIDLVAHYDPSEFWEKITSRNGRLVLYPDEFYVLATREEIGVPPNLAAEMIPYSSISGEFRVHYAGFFDPGFGWDGRAGGSRAVLEVRSYGVPFTLEHGQIVGWLRYGRVAGKPDKTYGADFRSNYQGQGVALAKHFKPWPT